MKSAFVLFSLFCLVYLSGSCQNQGINSLWQVGYASWAGPPYGGTDINFFTGNPIITYKNRPLDFSRTICNISDSSGNILFYTNGLDVCDSSNSIMQNGNNISPGPVHIDDSLGLPVPQACLIIPKPGSNHLYYLFHSSLDNYPYYTKAYYLYYSVIDMSLNGGKGVVTIKNAILLNDTLNPGKITACKHANGRDWWVVCHRFNSDLYYKFLITPNGISSPTTEAIGTVRSMVDIGQVAFSPNGEKFAYFNAYYTTTSTLDVYNFDRCTGNFSNESSIIISQSSGLGGGLAFSPNSQYLYVANIDSVYQFDVNSPNIESTKTTVAVWDSTYNPFATLFDMSQLAPDGKIYIATGNGTFNMHIVNHPDSAGLACNLVQHSLNLPAYYVGGGPNHPNYFLGPELGSICDSLPHVGIVEQSPEIILKLFPNPTAGKFTLWFPVHLITGSCEVYDVLGNLVFQEEIAQWSQYKHIDISNQQSGIYLCTINWNGNKSILKIAKE